MTLDEWLLDLMDGMPALPKRYEFRCHPDVYLALRDAAPPPLGEWSIAGAVGSPVGLYGSADIVVNPDLGSGNWELYENGQILKSGSLRPGENSKLRRSS